MISQNPSLLFPLLNKRWIDLITLPSYSDLKREAEKIGLSDNPEILKLLRLYTRDHTPENTKEKIADQLQRRFQEERENPFKSVSPNYRLQDRPIYIGDDWKNQNPYTLHESQLPEHILIAAQSGGGKTNLIQQLLQQLQKPYWALDLKRDYRHLLPHENNLTVIPVEKLQFNPFKPPPGTPWKEWKNQVIEVFCDSVHLLDASQNYIDQNIRPIYKKHLEDQQHPVHDPPTIHDLQQRIKNNNPSPRSKESQYRETVLNRLNKFTGAPTGKIFEDAHGLDLQYLLNQNVVFELDGLPSDVQNFLMEYLLEWVYQYRVQHQQRGGNLRHVFVIDEAKQLFDRNKEKQTAQGIPHIDYITSKIRTFGEGLVVSDQEARKLTETILANTDTKIILPNSDHNQLDEVSKSMGLNQLQRREAENLETGEAILTTGNQGPYRIDIKYSGVEEDVSEEQVYHSLEQTSLPSINTGLEEDYHPDEPNSSLPNISEQPEQDSIDLSEDAETLLESLASDPFKRITDHYEQFSSKSRGYKAKEELVKKDLIEKADTVNTGKGQRDLYQITENGREQLQQQGIDCKIKGRGGIKHQFWQHTLKQKIEDAGYAAKIEELDADIYANTGEHQFAVEIALSQSDREIDHVEKHLENDFDHVTTACQSKKIQRQLQQKLDSNSLDANSVDIRVIQEVYQEESWPQNLFNK